MFTVVVDGNPVYDPALTSAGNVIFSPSLSVGLNKSGEFSFQVPPTNPFYNDIEQLSSRIFVLNEGSYEDVLFVGRVLNVSIDFNKMKTVNCEGALSYLVDTVLRPYTFEGSPNELFEYYVGHHNANVDPYDTLGFRLAIGDVNVDAGTQVEEYSESYVSTLEELQSKLLDKYGGYIRSRWDNENKKITLDYISDIGRTNPQLIQYSRNLLDLVEDQPAEDIYTVAIPLGAQLFDEETNENLGRLSIADYPNEGDPDYVEASTEFIQKFGRIEKTFIFDYVEDQESLYTLGQYLVSFSALIPSRLTVKAIDLGLVDDTFKQIQVGDILSVVSPPHGVDRQMLCTAISYDLFEPANTTYDFDIEVTYSDKNTLSKRQNDTEHQLRSMDGQYLNVIENSMSIAEQHIQDARQEASAEITEAMGGYVYKTNSELYIMDTDDIHTATKVWRWNVGGLGYWSGQAGHATDPDAFYTVALTANGTANADILRGELVDTIEFNAEIGTVGGWSLGPNRIYKEVTDANDSTKRYRVSLFPPSTTNPASAKVLSFERSTDSGATYESTFWLRGDGGLWIASPNSSGAERIRIFDKTDPTKQAIINSNGVHIEHDYGYGSVQSHLFSVGLDFRNSNGEIVASYPGDGWQEFEVQDIYSADGTTTWYGLNNGPFRTFVCRRRFTNVSVAVQWGGILCGPSVNGCNFPAVAYPMKFRNTPIVIAQVSTPQNGNDGWLVTNTLPGWSPTDPTWFTPSYDLARGANPYSGFVVPEIFVSYFVFGQIGDNATVTLNLTNVTSSWTGSNIYYNDTLSATLTPDTGYIMDSVTVTMGGTNITADAYDPETNTIEITSVSGNIVITASAILDPNNPGGDGD